MGKVGLSTPMGPAEELSSYRWVVFGIWSVCSVSGFMVISTIGILLPAISSDLELSPGQQGTLGSIAYWGSTALTLPLGWWASRFRPKPLTTVTLIIGTLFLQGWASAFVVLLLGRLVFGISMMAREPARPLLIHQWFPPKEAILANSITSAMFGLVVGSGLIVTPLILDIVDDDWNMVLRIFGVFFVLLTVLWLVLGRERNGQESGQMARTWEIGLLRAALVFFSQLLPHADAGDL
jgi:MFS family permease